MPVLFQAFESHVIRTSYTNWTVSSINDRLKTQSRRSTNVLLRDQVFAIRTTRQLTQDELVWPALASHFRYQPVERDLRTRQDDSARISSSVLWAHKIPLNPSSAV